MRRSLLLLAAFALLAACGDDGKVGSKAPPAAPPPAAPPSAPAEPSPAGSPPQPPTAPVSASWAGTRAGDWATWRVVPEGGGAATRLTWRATRVEGGRVAFTVESTTQDAAGATIATTRTEEVHDLAAPAAAAPVRGEARGEEIRVGAVAVPTTVRVLGTARGDVQTWTSASVPFTGLVRARGAGVEQSLEEFGRGR